MALANFMLYGGSGYHEVALYPSTSVKKALPQRNYNTKKINFSPDGSMAAVAFNSSNIAIYDTETWQVITPHGAESSGELGRWSPDGTLYAVATGKSDDEPTVFDTTTTPWTRLTGLPTHSSSSAITSVAISPNNQLMALTCYDAPFLYVIDLNAKTILPGIDGFTLAQNDVDFSPDGSLLAVGGTAPRYTVFEVATWTKKNTSGDRTGNSVRFSPDGSKLAIGYNSGNGLTFYDVAAETASEPIDAGNSVQQVDWSPSGDEVAVAIYGNGAKVYDLATATLLATAKGGTVNGIAFSPDLSVPSRKIKTINSDGTNASVTVQVHDPETGAKISDIASSGEAEVLMIEPGSFWLAAKDTREGGEDKLKTAEVSKAAGELEPLVFALNYLGDTVTISSNLTTQAGAAGDEVVIRNWTTRELVAKVIPDANGDWSAEVPPGTYDVSYIAENCAPVIHGPYTVELP